MGTDAPSGSAEASAYEDPCGFTTDALMPPTRCRCCVVRRSRMRSHVRMLRSLDADTTCASPARTASPTTRALCSLSVDTSCREATSHTRTSPPAPPVTKNCRSFDTAMHVTPSTCASGSVQSSAPSPSRNPHTCPLPHPVRIVPGTAATQFNPPRMRSCARSVPIAVPSALMLHARSHPSALPDTSLSCPPKQSVGAKSTDVTGAMCDSS
mmetsp:Transcript_10235/g.37068  ORF Transcript_10235/g.37068 Transcript_10235/m.37068 type:complete len:211 (-) Transcript_10235:768-1400(-)